MNKKSSPAETAKAARLAAALRENLKRRKAQAKARAEKPETAPATSGEREPQSGQD